MPANTNTKRTAGAKAAPPGRERVFVVLLRGINVAGQKRVPMQELRALATEVGCTGVVSYIQSGNLVLSASASASALESTLERSITEHFGFEVAVITRSAEDWLRYAAGSAFRAVETERPHLLLLGLAKRPLGSATEAALQARATAGEQVKVVGDAIWIDYASTVGRSKLTPAVLDRAAGSTVTARNWRTVLKLAEMVRTFGEVGPKRSAR